MHLCQQVVKDSLSATSVAQMDCRWQSADCPHDCPCDAPKRRLQSQREPTRLFREMEEGERFTRKSDDVREASFRLANRRLQPLGHLTLRESSASPVVRPGGTGRLETEELFQLIALKA
jgi:hypothetical protein